MDWSGGLYISPSQAGSRSGGLIAQTWAALVHVGHDGYVERARDVLEVAVALRDAIDAIDDLGVLGEDVTMVVAWRSTDPDVDVYVLNDVMTKGGWHLSVLHAPPALHYCVTPANVRSVGELAKALAAATVEVRAMRRRRARRGGREGAHLRARRHSDDRGLIEHAQGRPGSHAKKRVMSFSRDGRCIHALCRVCVCCWLLCGEGSEGATPHRGEVVRHSPEVWM